MKEGKYLSEVIDYSEIKRGRLNMVVAKTGQGKTTMATQSLPQQLNIKNYSRVLYLIDTNIGRDMLLQKEELIQNFPPQEQDKIITMTYAKFGSLLKSYEIYSSMFDLIVADEFHNLVKYAHIDMAKMVKANPNFSQETLSMMLARESNNYRAMETLKRWSSNSSLFVVAMTATPENFLEKDAELNQLISIIQSKEQLVAYEVLARYIYTNAEEVLIGAAEEGEKRLIFTHSVKQAQDFKNMIENNTERKALALWSPSNNLPMNKEQQETRQYLLDNESFPDDLDDLFLTEAYTTGWNLIDDRVTTTVIHSGNPTIIKQFCGRNRQDIKKLYLYDSSKAEEKKKNEKRKELTIKVEWEVPEKYLNIPLDTEMRSNLILEIGFPKKWTTFKKWLEQSPLYAITKKKIKGNEYWVISIKEQAQPVLFLFQILKVKPLGGKKLPPPLIERGG